MHNYKMILEYDGTRYQGWQRLASTQNTIQGKLEEALTQLCQEPITISGSGRTDAGTHARRQVASFHTNSRLTATVLCKRLRHMLPEDIGLVSLDEAAPRFHARLNASDKTYCYRVWNSNQPCVFERRYVYCSTTEYDLEKMQSAAKLFLGEHDFCGFSANKHSKKSTVRRLDLLQIKRMGPELRFTVTGDGFLHHMVRILVGTLLEVGAGSRDPGTIEEIFVSGDRAQAGETVPAKGLCLMEVRYH